MPVSVNGIDHVVIRVGDLDAAQALYERLGFTLTPRGYHTGRGSANHTAPLASGNYFELIHLPPGGDAGRFGGRAEGPVALALVPEGTRKVHAELVALGYDVPAPRDLARPVALSSGTRDARFLNASFPEVAPEAVSLFVCQHLTRDLVWRPEWEAHPNGVDRVTRAIVVHPSPATLAETHRRLFGEAHVQVDTAGLAIHVGSDLIDVLTPLAFAVQFPGIAVPSDLGRGWFAGATLRTRTLDTAVALLRDARLAPQRTPAGTIIVPPEAVGGALLEFRAA